MNSSTNFRGKVVDSGIQLIDSRVHCASCRDTCSTIRQRRDDSREDNNPARPIMILDFPGRGVFVENSLDRGLRILRNNHNLRTLETGTLIQSISSIARRDKVQRICALGRDRIESCSAATPEFDCISHKFMPFFVTVDNSCHLTTIPYILLAWVS